MSIITQILALEPILIGSFHIVKETYAYIFHFYFFVYFFLVPFKNNLIF